MRVHAGARTPEDLDALLEDCLLLRDGVALARLFDDTAVLVSGGTRLARGGREIAGAMLALWEPGRAYVAGCRPPAGTSGTALILADEAISVARRDSEGVWRYLIFLLMTAPVEKGQCDDIDC